jgi:hypothetical protein
MSKASSRLLINHSCVLFCAVCVLCGSNGRSQSLDPAAWGSDHVGKPMPEYVTGDECLFCHRNDIGAKWVHNRHSLTIRDRDPASMALTELRRSAATKSIAADVTMLLGDTRRVRFLKRSTEYGKLDLLTSQWQPPRNKEPGKLIAPENPTWNSQQFGDSCAGCHTTGVDSQQRTFSAISLDCYACHGDVSLEHAKQKSAVYLGHKTQESARVTTSICAQCHLRDGKSKSTRLPYPNNFVAGDNLFRDYQVDLSPEHAKSLNPGDRHVVENVRDVVLLGKEEVTCLSCHEIHKMSSRKHHRLAENESCLLCHNPKGSKKVRPEYEVHSRTCEY